MKTAERESQMPISNETRLKILGEIKAKIAGNPVMGYVFKNQENYCLAMPRTYTFFESDDEMKLAYGEGFFTVRYHTWNTPFKYLGEAQYRCETKPKVKSNLFLISLTPCGYQQMKTSAEEAFAKQEEKIGRAFLLLNSPIDWQFAKFRVEDEINIALRALMPGDLLELDKINVADVQEIKVCALFDFEFSMTVLPEHWRIDFL